MNITLHKKDIDHPYNEWPIINCNIDDKDSFFAWPIENFDKDITELSDDVINGLENIKKFSLGHWLSNNRTSNITEINCNLSNLCYADRSFAHFHNLNSFLVI